MRLTVLTEVPRFRIRCPVHYGLHDENFFTPQINSGGGARIIATPSDMTAQATYSGANSLLTTPSSSILM